MSFQRLDKKNSGPRPPWKTLGTTMRISRTATALAALATGLATPAAAQDAFAIDEIVVSANLGETEASRTGTSVTVLTAEEIEKTGETRLTDLLARLPGVGVLARGPLGTQTGLTIRGVSQNYIKVLVDGIDVADPSGPQVAYDFGRLTSFGVDRIEVLRGSQSALYGTQAIGGVISLGTALPEEEGVAQAAAVARTRPEPAAAELARLVEEQVTLARRQVERQLARSRAAAASRLPGTRTRVLPALQGLLRVLERVHADRGVVLRIGPAALAGSAAFAGDEQDLQEMLGNVLDNAFKWARGEVRVDVLPASDRAGAWLRIVVDDDGPGVAPADRDAVMQRGVRADESVPGSGLGLAIVGDLVALHGGEVNLSDGPLGGLRVELLLPAAA